MHCMFTYTRSSKSIIIKQNCAVIYILKLYLVVCRIKTHTHTHARTHTHAHNLCTVCSLIHDLPKALSQNTHVAQYADNIAIWIDTTLRKHTTKSVCGIPYVQKSYQSELNKLIIYIYDQKNWS